MLVYQRVFPSLRHETSASPEAETFKSMLKNVMTVRALCRENGGKTPWDGGTLNNQPHIYTLHNVGIYWVYHIIILFFSLKGHQQWGFNS